MFAFLPSLGWQEMLLLIMLGLLLYGRNLPQAGRTMGRFVAQMKRGFQDFKDQLDRDESLREVRKTIDDTTREMRNVTAVPRAITDPGSAVREFTRDAMEQPVDDDKPDEPPPPAPTEQPEHPEQPPVAKPGAAP
ncbi:MAG: hypothetical protein JNK15_25030 [Planctomycetes bacterium]|nr:hypothetical protein [Planctomycetota bacterium]